MGETGKRFLWNVGTSFVARATVKLISFIITIFIINHLGREQFGIYSIVLNFAMVWMVVIDFGWVDMMVREISRQREQTTRFISTYFIAQLGLSVFAIMLFLLVIAFSGYESTIRSPLLIITIGLFLFGFTRPFHSVLVAHEAIDRVAFLSFFSSLFGSMFLLAGVILRQPLAYFIWGFNFYILLQCLFYFLYARVKIQPWQFLPDFQLMKHILVMSVPFTMVLVLSVLLKQLDVILLSKLKSPEECGIYASANKFVFPFLMFSEAVQLSIFPILSRQETFNPEAFHRSLTKTVKYSLAIGLYLAVLIFSLAPEIIVTLLKTEFHPAIKVLRILIWYLPLLYMSRLLFYGLMSLNKMRLLVITHTLVLGLFMILNLILVPEYASLGTAIAVVVTNLILLLLLWSISVFRKFLSINLSFAPRLIISLMVMILTFILLKQIMATTSGYIKLLICGGGATLVYGIMLVATGFISLEERQQLFTIIRPEYID